jgi:outer membrane protein assembly factor BamB
MNAVNQLKFLDWLPGKFRVSTGFPFFLFLLSLFVTGCGEKNIPDEGVSGADADGSAIVADWPLFRGDPEMQGIAREVIEPPLELAWTYEPAVEEGKRRPPIEASPVIVGGVVFVGTQGGEFLAIHLESGELKWKFDAEGPVTAPAAASEEAVFFGDQYGFVYALHAETGEEIWRFETEGKIEGGVNLLTDASGKTSVYIGSHDYFLYSFDSETGEVLWKYETDNYIVATPSLVNSGGSQAVCFGGCDGLLHILPANGEAIDQAKTEVEIGSYVANSAAVRDGIAYVAHNDGEIIAIDVAAREEVWRVVTNTKYLASPAVDENSLYVSGPDKRLVAYDRVTGEEKWSFLATRSLDSSPVVSGDVIWQGGMDGRLYAVNRADGSELWQFELGAQIKASPAVSRGTLVVCGSDGVVYAFR